MSIIRDIWLCLAIFVGLFLFSMAALDAWTYEQYGNCDYCWMLKGYFEGRGE